MIHTKPDKVLLRIGLGLRNDTAELEGSWLHPFERACSYIDGFVLQVPSHYECPGALEHWLVRAFVDICRAQGIPLYWGRHLWVMWSEHSSRAQHLSDVYDPTYYAACLHGIAVEAEAVGAVGTVIDTEPYGDTIYKPWFKDDGLHSWEARQIEVAIKHALRMVRPVDFVSPASSLASNWYGWWLRYLGLKNFHPRSYCVRKAEDFRANPPDDMSLDLDCWGVLLGAAGNPHNALTVDEYAMLDFARIKELYPVCRCVWLNPVAESRRDVLYRLGELAG